MSRAWRIEYEGAYYHLLSRGNQGDDIFINNDDRIVFLDTLGEMSERFEMDVYAYVLMDNHYHILVRVIPEYNFSDEDNIKRYVDYYGDERIFADGLVPSLRLKLSSLSEFMPEIKVSFARFYNRRQNRSRAWKGFIR